MRNSLRNSSHSSQQTAAEHHNLAAHTHNAAAVHHGQEEHLTGHEHSRQASEHSNTAHQQTVAMDQKARDNHIVIVSAHTATEEDIAVLAYQLWQDRGCPNGSSQDDWFRAVEELEPRH
jgi:hypothetical protein